MASAVRRSRRQPATLLVAVAVVLRRRWSLVALRLLPGSPLAAQAAARWETADAPPRRARAGPPTAPAAGPAAVRARRRRSIRCGARRPSVEIDRAAGGAGRCSTAVPARSSARRTCTKTSTTASMIKAWIAADYLRRAAETGETPSDAPHAAAARDDPRQRQRRGRALYNEVGRAASIKRLIDICKLTDSKRRSRRRLEPHRCSPPADTARHRRTASPTAGPPGRSGPSGCSTRCGRCAATGDFGIRKAFPAAEQKTIAIKNGWVDRPGRAGVPRQLPGHRRRLDDGRDGPLPDRQGYDYGTHELPTITEQVRAS